MTTAVKAVYENGVFKPIERVHLKEKTEVDVLIPVESRPDDDDPTGWKTARDSSAASPRSSQARTSPGTTISISTGAPVIFVDTGFFFALFAAENTSGTPRRKSSFDS
jgi:hypothetical protein